MDAYSVLKLSPSATVEEIRTAYRTLVRRHHPDRPDGDELVFLRVQAAYQLLIDPESRAAHDKDPETTLEARMAAERRRRQLSRRRSRLRKLYD